MDEDASFGFKVREFVTRNVLFIGVVAVGLGMCLFGLFQYLASNSSESHVKLISHESSQVAQADITVDVGGEVVKPGVYKLPSDSRLQDALDSAGGLTKKADSEYISKKVNLAQKVSDGTKIYIPAIGEINEDISVLGSNSVVETVSADTSGDISLKVNINSAGMDALENLPRVGPVTAQKIIDGRPYGTIDELVAKKILGQKTFDGLRDQIVAQ